MGVPTSTRRLSVALSAVQLLGNLGPARAMSSYALSAPPSMSHAKRAVSYISSTVTVYPWTSTVIIKPDNQDATDFNTITTASGSNWMSMQSGMPIPMPTGLGPATSISTASTYPASITSAAGFPGPMTLMSTISSSGAATSTTTATVTTTVTVYYGTSTSQMGTPITTNVPWINFRPSGGFQPSTGFSSMMTSSASNNLSSSAQPPPTTPAQSSAPVLSVSRLLTAVLLLVGLYVMYEWGLPRVSD